MQQTITTGINANMFLSLPPSRYERNNIKWQLKIDAVRNTSWLTRNIAIRRNQWNKTTYTRNQDKRLQRKIYTTLCTNHDKCTSNNKTEIWMKFTLILSAHQFRQVFSWMKLGNRKAKCITMNASRINQKYRRMDMNGTIEFTANFASQQCLYRFIDVDSESWKSTKAFASQRNKRDELDEQLQKRTPWNTFDEIWRRKFYDEVFTSGQHRKNIELRFQIWRFACMKMIFKCCKNTFHVHWWK